MRNVCNSKGLLRSPRVSTYTHTSRYPSFLLQVGIGSVLSFRSHFLKSFGAIPRQDSPRGSSMDWVSRYWTSLDSWDPRILRLSSEALSGTEPSGRHDDCCRQGLRNNWTGSSHRGFWLGTWCQNDWKTEWGEINIWYMSLLGLFTSHPAGLLNSYTFRPHHTFCCRGLISNPRPVLDFSTKTTQSMLLDFFVKPQNMLVWLVTTCWCFPGCFRHNIGPFISKLIFLLSQKYCLFGVN